MENLTFILIVQGIVCGAYCATVAEAKNLSGVGWFFGGLFFSIIALLAVSGMPINEVRR